MHGALIGSQQSAGVGDQNKEGVGGEEEMFYVTAYTGRMRFNLQDK